MSGQRMPQTTLHQSILILDFGSQVTQLIARRVRESGVYYEIWPFNQAGVGKASFDEAKIVENVNYFIDVIKRARPAGAKGTYIKKITVSSTMGPGIKIDLTSLAA